MKFSKALVANFTAFALTALTGLLINLLGAKTFSPEVLGVFNQALAVFIFGGQLAALGFQYSVVHFVSIHRDNIDRASSEAFGALSLTAIFALLVAVCIHSSAKHLSDLLGSDHLQPALDAVAWGIFFFALNKTLMGAISGFFKMGAFAFFTALRALFLMGLFSAFVHSQNSQQVHLDPFLLIEIFCVAEVLLFACLLAYFLRLLRFPTPDGDFWIGTRKTLKRHLSFGIFACFGGVMLELNTRVDVLMLGYFKEDSLVGFYSFAAFFAEGFFQIIVVFQNYFNPQFAKLIAEKSTDAFEKVLKQAQQQAFLVTGSVGLVAILLYKPVLSLLVDASWVENAPVLYILIAGIVVTSPWLVFMHGLSMGGRPGLQSLYLGSALLYNIVLNAVLIPHYGGVGAAIATALSLVMSTLTLKWMSRRFLGVKI